MSDATKADRQRIRDAFTAWVTTQTASIGIVAPAIRLIQIGRMAMKHHRLTNKQK